MGCVNSVEAPKSSTKRESSGTTRPINQSGSFPFCGSTEQDTTTSGRFSVRQHKPVWDLRGPKSTCKFPQRDLSLASVHMEQHSRIPNTTVPLRRNQSSPRVSIPGWSTRRTSRNVRFSPSPLTLRSTSFASGSAGGSFTSECMSATPPGSPLCRSSSLNVSVATRRGIIRATSHEELSKKAVITKSYSSANVSEASRGNTRPIRVTGGLRIRSSMH